MMTMPLLSSLLPQPPLPSRCNSNNDHGNHDVPRQNYQYVPFDIFETDWLGDPRRLPLVSQSPSPPQQSHAADADAHVDDLKSNSHGNDDGINPLTAARYSPGTLVWVLLSKGKPKHPIASTATDTPPLSACADALAIHKKRRDKKNKPTVISNGNTCTRVGEIITTQSRQQQQEKDESTFTTTALTVNHHHSRKEFFLRARVIADDEEIMISKKSSSSSQWERRVLVRYSRGATYRVHAYNLIPVLEPSVHNISSFSEGPSKTATTNVPSNYPPLVVIVPETNIYRRVAKVHTTPEDTFMEIGCDYGITVEKIRQSLEEAGDVPKVWAEEILLDDNDDKNSGDNEEGKQHWVSCLGIDKSVESINIANKRFPKCKFALGDVLLPNDMSYIRTLCEQLMVRSAPSIICIDVNGNREIDGVIACLKMVVNEAWKQQPRMIIVKSRFLYWEVKRLEI